MLVQNHLVYGLKIQDFFQWALLGLGLIFVGKTKMSPPFKEETKNTMAETAMTLDEEKAPDKIWTGVLIY